MTDIYIYIYYICTLHTMLYILYIVFIYIYVYFTFYIYIYIYTLHYIYVHTILNTIAMLYIYIIISRLVFVRSTVLVSLLTPKYMVRWKGPLVPPRWELCPGPPVRSLRVWWRHQLLRWPGWRTSSAKGGRKGSWRIFTGFCDVWPVIFLAGCQGLKCIRGFC